MSIIGFFKKQVEIAHVLGIPVRIDYRWFFVFVLMMWLTASNIPKEFNLDPLVALLLGALTTLAFFLSIFGHELAHAIAARFEGIQTREIVLHPFGGVARLEREPDNARGEFRIAVAGPAASFLIGIAFTVATLIASASGAHTAAAMLFLLAFGNILLAIFNLFPGYPLDGGRVLRAFLWKQGYELNEATRITGRSGQVIAIALIAFGLFITVWRGDLFTGLWTALVGVFLLDAAVGIVGHTLRADKITVGEVMSVPIALKPETTIGSFIDHTLPLHRMTAFPVAQNRRLHGVLTLEDLKKLPRERWHKTLIREVMRPVTEELFVSPDERLNDARELMRENGAGALAVVDERGLLVGFLQRGKIRKKSEE
jgi:Zn-dependent protease/CBS domain-containing protein